MTEDLKILLRVLGACVAAIAVLIGSCVAGAYLNESFACSNLQRMTGVETNVSVALGCMVKYRGEWVAREVMTNHKQDINVK